MQRSIEDRLREMKQHNRAFRVAQVRSIDTGTRSVELAFSSEAEVSRPWGIEVLDHSPGAVVLNRLRDGAPLLLNHNDDDQIGVIESVSIDTDRKGRAVVRFGTGERADEIFQDVQGGIRKHVSVGYLIHETRQSGEKHGEPVFLVTSWEPYEISIVPVPADISVGVGRNLNPSTQKDTNMMKIQKIENPLAGLFSEARKATGVSVHERPGSDPVYMDKKPCALRTLVLKDTSIRFDKNGQIAIGDTWNSAGETITLEAAILRRSRVSEAGANFIRLESITPVPCGQAGDWLMVSRPTSFSTVDPAPFTEILEDVNGNFPDCGASPLSILRETISKCGRQLAVSFKVSRVDQKKVDAGQQADEILTAIIAGIARAADKVLLEKILSKTPTAFSMAAAAASGLRFGQLRGLIGTAAAGASVRGDGVLTVSGVPAELTDTVSGTIIGAFDRSALVLGDELQILATRVSKNGDLEVSAWLDLAGLVPDVSKFFTVEV